MNISGPEPRVSFEEKRIIVKIHRESARFHVYIHHLVVSVISGHCAVLYTEVKKRNKSETKGREKKKKDAGIEKKLLRIETRVSDTKSCFRDTAQAHGSSIQRVGSFQQSRLKGIES